MLYSVFNELLCILKRSRDPLFRAGRCLLVGLDGLEPSTSRLSGARSSHLSYRPLSSRWTWFQSSWWRWWESNPWPPACRAGALPAELHPRLGFWKINQWSSKIEQQDLRASKPSSRQLVKPISEYERLPWNSFRFSIERRWSSRTFRYGYLVTT